MDTPNTNLPVHPHARGEHSKALSMIQPLTGSSPRPWGTQEKPELATNYGRFIPTPVGNTSPNKLFRPLCSVHPHARGEHGSPPSDTDNTGGSSPRPWGTQRKGHPKYRGHRFIPTPVGNTTQGRSGRVNVPVHPHARGEHEFRQVDFESATGSSPRPWGTPPYRQRLRACTRFIPTPVGNTFA